MLELIELLAAFSFLVIVVISHFVSAAEGKRRGAEAAEEAAKPRVNCSLADARRLGCPL